MKQNKRECNAAEPCRPHASAMRRSRLTASIRPAINLLSSRQLMNASFEPLHLVNTYGAFGSVSRQRATCHRAGKLKILRYVHQ